MQGPCSLTPEIGGGSREEVMFGHLTLRRLRTIAFHVPRLSPACFFWTASLPLTFYPSQAPGSRRSCHSPHSADRDECCQACTAVFAVTDQSAVGPVLIDNGLASSPSKEHPRLVQPPFLKRGRSHSRLAFEDGVQQEHCHMKR